MPFALADAPPVRHLSVAPLGDVPASIPDSCWIAGAVDAIAAKSPGALRDAIRELPDGHLGLRYFRLGYPDSDDVWATPDLTYLPHLHATSWRSEQLRDEGWYRFVEAGVFSLIPRLNGGQPSDVLALLLGQKFKMVQGPRALDRARAELADPNAPALPVFGTRSNAGTPFVPDHAYLLTAATPDGFTVQDSVTRRTFNVDDATLAAALHGVSVRDAGRSDAFGFTGRGGATRRY
ncbi:MAG: hypothetical protein RIT81_36510 [Deltaproteobacteria bacterium]